MTSGHELISARKESYRAIVHVMCHGYSTQIPSPWQTTPSLGCLASEMSLSSAGLKIESLSLGKDFKYHHLSCHLRDKPRLSSL